MSILGQVKRYTIVTPSPGGFSLSQRWMYDPGLVPADKIIDELSDLGLLSLTEYYSPPYQLMPEYIPQGTTYRREDMSIWTTPHDAWISDMYYASGPGISGAPTPDKIWIEGNTAHYSYEEFPQPSDPKKLYGNGDWAYPGGDKHYVPDGDWPAPMPFELGQWVHVASETSTYSTFKCAVFLCPSSLDSYNLISWGTYPLSASMDAAGQAAYFDIEGKRPIQTQWQIMLEYGITAELRYEGGNRFLYMWQWPQYPYGPVEEPFGFHRARPATNVAAAGGVSPLVAALSALGTRPKKHDNN